jgi:hypothetical protein
MSVIILTSTLFLLSPQHAPTHARTHPPLSRHQNAFIEQVCICDLTNVWSALPFARLANAHSERIMNENRQAAVTESRAEVDSSQSKTAGYVSSMLTDVHRLAPLDILLTSDNSVIAQAPANMVALLGIEHSTNMDQFAHNVRTTVAVLCLPGQTCLVADSLKLRKV